MKNLKVYKKALAVLSAGTLVLFSGCSLNSTYNDIETTILQTEKKANCRHLIVYFEDKPITFKECEGYEVKYDDGYYSSSLYYEVKKDNQTILEGMSLKYNAVDVLHNIVDHEFNVESLEKVK